MNQVMERPRSRHFARLLVSFALFASAASTTAFAINGNVYISQCATCSTVAGFTSVALNQATLSGNAGTYVLSSQTSPRSALVAVSGNRQWRCDSHGENCVPRLINATARAVDFSGATVTSDAQLDTVDQKVFGSDRSKPIVLVLKVPSDYASSIVDSNDAETEGAIIQALNAKGILLSSIPNGSLIMVIFADNTKATFTKANSFSTYQFVWTGDAWDAQGRPINRDGSLKTNPNTAGAGGGSGTLFPFVSGSDIRYVISFSGMCTSTTTISIGGSIVSRIAVIHPC